MGEVSLHNCPSRFRLINTILNCTIYRYRDTCILYIAVNISRITVDKYGGPSTIRGTSASFSTRLSLIIGCHTAPKRLCVAGRYTYCLPTLHLIKLDCAILQLWSLFVHSLPFRVFLFVFLPLSVRAGQSGHL